MKLPFTGRTAQQAAFEMHIIQSMVVPSFVLDHEGKVILWNSAVEQLTGLAKDAVIGTKEHWRGFYDHCRPCLADLLFDDASGASKDLYVAQKNIGADQRSRTAET